MKSLCDVTTCLAQDLGEVCDVSVLRDIKTIAQRYEHEGDSFLTITLPEFAKGLEQALENGGVAPSAFSAFAFRRGLPRFLGGFLEQVFDRSSGRILDNPSVDAIRAVRQLCLLHSRVSRPCAEKREAAAIRRYVECEQELRAHVRQISSQSLQELRKIFALLWGGVLADVSRLIDDDAIVPKHGPGATSDRLKGNRKWLQAEWTKRLERSFPSISFLVPNPRHWRDLERVSYLEPGDERPVRVITVPKTLKTPRIIAIEPTCMQYAQQALLEALVRRIETDDLMSRLVGFSDQSENRDLARLGSVDGFLATLDLSEASDRVSNHLVWHLTKPFGAVHTALQDCRSRRADVPGYGVIRLAKFASMGSAVCFPIEAMVFLSVVFYGMQSALRRPLTRRDIASAVGTVRVYGDDIIVPVRYVQHVQEALTLFGFKVNLHKSFWRGRFRESCGGDFFAGADVSVHRFRRDLPRTRQDHEELISLIEFRNRCYLSGYWGTAERIDQLLARLRVPMPRVGPESPVLGRRSHLGYAEERYDPNLQIPLVKGLLVRTTIPENGLDGVPALMKVLTKRGNKPYDVDHLRRSGRPDLVRTKVGWGRAY